MWAVRKSIYGISIPAELVQWLSGLEVFSFELGGFLLPSWTCAGSLTTRLLFTALWPLGLILAVTIALISHEALRKGTLRRALTRSVEPAILISFFLLPSVTNTLFLALPCETFHYNDVAKNSTSKMYLSASLDVECSSTDHVRIHTTAWILIVLWPVATPLLYALLLFHCRHAIAKNKPTAISSATRFLWETYDDCFFWWELVELGRRLLLTNFVLFIDLDDGGSDKLLRLFVALLISVCSMVLQLIAQPFRCQMDDAISALVQLALVLFFANGILLKLCKDEGSDTVHSLVDAQIESSQTCSTMVGLESAYSASVLITILSIVVFLTPFCLFLYTAAVRIMKERRAAEAVCNAVLKMGRMTRPPTCNWKLKEGHTYLTFLSHCKSEAGIDARYLSEMIHRMTGCPAYLDSTDLVDLRTLFNEGVHKTDILFILATESVFTRPWCLLEMWEAAVNGVPVMFYPVFGGKWTLEATVTLLSDMTEHMGERNPQCMFEVMQHVNRQGRQHDDFIDVREVEDVLLAHLGLVPSLERPGRPSSADLDKRLCARLQISVLELDSWLKVQHARVKRQLETLSWRSMDSDNLVIASVQTLLNEAAVTLGREELMWTSLTKHNTGLLQRVSTQTKFARTLTAAAAVKILKKEPSARPPETSPTKAGGTSFSKGSFSRGPLALSPSMRRRRASLTPTADDGTLLIVCSREETGDHLGMLQREFGKRLQSHVVIGAEEVGMGSWHCEVQNATRGVVLLQTKSVLRSPVRLLQLYEATLQRRPLVCINVVGGGYDYDEAAALLLSPVTELSEAQMTTLCNELGNHGHIVGHLTSSLIKNVPKTISVSFNAAAGELMAQAMVKDALEKLQRKDKLLRTDSIENQVVLEQHRRKALRRAGSVAVLSGLGSNGCLDRLGIDQTMTTKIAMDEPPGAAVAAEAHAEEVVPEGAVAKEAVAQKAVAKEAVVMEVVAREARVMAVVARVAGHSFVGHSPDDEAEDRPYRV